MENELHANEDDSAASDAHPSHHVWDLPLRLFHWSLVISVVGSIASAKLEFVTVHEHFGLAVMGLVIFRLIWGVTGSQTARFSQFIKSPKLVLQTLIAMMRGESNTRAGHSAVGGYATLALLGICLFMAISGSISTDDALYQGPLASFFPSFNNLAETLHNRGENIIFGIIGLHIAALVFYFLRLKKNLVPAMVTGKRKLATGPSGLISSSHNIFGVGLLLFCFTLSQSLSLL